MRDITVLITGIGAPGAPGIVKSIRKNGERNIKIIGVDTNFDASGKDLVDEFYEIPPAEDSKFIDGIMKICKKEKVDIIQPLVTRELLKFAKYKDYFNNSNIIVNVMDEKNLKIANNKGKLLSTLRQKGIPTPEFYITNKIEDIEKAFNELGYPDKPVCIKVTDSNGSRGVRIVDPSFSKAKLFFNSKPSSLYISYDELIKTLEECKELPEMIVMEYLPGEEYSVDILADNGNVIYSVCRRGTTVVSGIQLVCVVERQDYIINECENICNVLNLSGNFGLDIKENRFGVPLVMEINPRLTAGIVACVAAGINLPYFGIKQALREEIPICDIDYGTKMLRRWEEIFLDINDDIVNW